MDVTTLICYEGVGYEGVDSVDNYSSSSWGVLRTIDQAAVGGAPPLLSGQTRERRFACVFDLAPQSANG